MSDQFKPSMIKNIFIVFFIILGTINAATIKTQLRPVTYSPHLNQQVCHMNMGPTGARAWMRGYDFVIMSIDQGSPCYGHFELGDVVIGIDGNKFGENNDSRKALGNAIEVAESKNSPLDFIVYRKGVEIEISFELPALGAYSNTWPYNCSKSSKILNAACESLLLSQLPNGRIMSDGNMGTFLSGLLFLGSDNPKYLDAARRAAYFASKQNYANTSLNNWAMGYGSILMAEYYLATGDDAVLEKLQSVVETIAEGQMLCGSWGHKSPGEGYGALNQPGITCAIALVLAKECGLKINQKVLDKALQFFGKFADLGCIPYGDHFPGRNLDDNGHNSSAGILHRLADKPEKAAIFCDTVSMSYFMREEGHTGGLFSIMWGPLCASMATDKKFNAFMDYQQWYYNLARTWKGGFIHLPYKEALTRFDSSGYIEMGGDVCTGAIALSHALPLKKLRILGAPRSVFGSELSGELFNLRNLFLTKKWDAFDRLLSRINPLTLKSQTEKRWLEQFKKIRNFNIKASERTLIEIDSNLNQNAAYRSSEQFKALKTALGEKGHPAFEGLEKRFSSGSIPWYTSEGVRLYETWEKFYGVSLMGWVPSGQQNRRFIENLTTLRLPIWEALSPISQVQAQTWKTLKLKPKIDPPIGWTSMDFDDRKWVQEKSILSTHTLIDTIKDEIKNKIWSGIACRRIFNIEDPNGVKLRLRLKTVRRAVTKVYLNDKLIVNVPRGKRGGYAEIELDESVFSLLKKGTNILALTSTNLDIKNNKLDAGLEINRTNIETRTLPVLRTKKIYAEDLPDRDNVLQVSNENKKYREKLQTEYDSKGHNELLQNLRSQIPYVRLLAVNAFVRKGTDSISKIMSEYKNSDWKVKSSLSIIIKTAHAKFIENESENDLKQLGIYIPHLTELLKDRNYWVRLNAANALARFKETAESSIPSLMSLLEDSEEWVRIAAIKAIYSISKDPETLTQASEKALNNHGTSYGVPRTAYSIIKKNKLEENVALESLLHFLENPPEGGGGVILGHIMKTAMERDPNGYQLIPVLINSIKDNTRYSLQRGNPRAKAIAILSEYGNKAVVAIPTLNALLKSDIKKDKAQHENAKKAIASILGNVSRE
jgi:HEAT repeat protein